MRTQTDEIFGEFHTNTHAYSEYTVAAAAATDVYVHGTWFDIINHKRLKTWIKCRERKKQVWS